MPYCANCGREIAATAAACPVCGHPNELRGSATGVQLARFGQRFLAWLLDAIVLGIVGYVVGPLGALGWFLYGWLMIGLNDGRTLGKMALGIRVAFPDGGRVDLGTAAARAAMSLVSGLAVFVGYLWAIWDPERRTWHDMVANTRAFSTG